MMWTKTGSEPLFFDWNPVPGRAWIVRKQGGFAVKAFSSLRSGMAWLEKKGYNLDLPK